MKNLNLLLISLYVLILTSCAVGRKAQYDKMVASIDFQGTKSVTIAVLDHRSHVLTEGKPLDFTGYLRAGVGIPYPIGTRTGKPLADDFASSVNQTLSGKGFKCSVSGTTPKDAENDVISKLKASGPDISIMFLMNSWWTDTYMPTLLNYEIVVSIFDKAGNKLSSKKFAEEKKNIGTDFWGKPQNNVIPEGFKKELGIILNDPEIKKYLQ